MGVNVNTQPTEKYYIDGKGFDICSRDSFGFSIIREDGTVEYIRNTDCDWFARLTRQNTERITEIKKDIESYKHYQDLAYKAERQDSLAIGQMRREFGVTLCDANDEQRKDFGEKKDSYYANSMEAVIWGNKINNAHSTIRHLNSSIWS